MKYISSLLFILLALAFFTPKASAQDADDLLHKAINAHGGKKYKKAHYQFVFRDKVYRFKNSKSGYEYSVRKSANGAQIFDQLTNGNLTRTINGLDSSLGKKEKMGASSGLNSVIYFATLPYKLLDPAVNLKHGGSTTINGQGYELLHVTFDKEGGGVDHDDQFIYWIRKDNHRIDFLAYNYTVNGGGVRFRTAYNTRDVGGILFQDYVNYKAPIGTPLADLPSLYEKEELKKLSVIATESVVKL